VTFGPEALRAALAAHRVVDHPALPGRTNHLRAGVLVPLVWRAGGPVALLQLRPATMRRHAGEISFPGGKPEAQDLELVDTALREAREELGIAGAQVLGRLSSIPLFTSDYRLEPFVAAVPDAPLVPQPGEVERVLEVSLRDALAAPEIPAVPYVLDGEDELSPLFFPDGRTLYGATAHALLELLQVVAPLFGVAVPPLVPSRAFDWPDLLRGAERLPPTRGEA
jgi:8-oxo-dGTP pyrophosphatase MutT (NUDIX family)